MKAGNFKAVFKGMSAIIIYLILQSIQSVPLDILKIDINTLSLSVKVLYLLIYDIIFMIIIFILFKKNLAIAFQDIKKNHQQYFKKYFKYWLLALGIMVASNIIINLISPNAIAGNEEIIRNNLMKAPFYTFFATVIFAPFVEELVFRQGIKEIFTSKWLFIVFSGLLFGSLHVFGTMESFFDLLYLIPYSTPGFIFAYTLYESDNIFVPMGLHFIHNGIMTSLQILLFIIM